MSTIGEVGTVPGSQFTAAVAGPGGKMGKDEFLRMLVTQLQNQDPLNPMKSDELAVQLAQFSSLEQLTNIGKAIEAQAAQQQNVLQVLDENAAVGMLGKTVVALGDHVTISETGAGSVSVEVGGSGGNATLRIFDESGNEVGSRVVGWLGGGRQSVDLGGAADGLAPGRYTYALEVLDSSGKKVPTQPLMTGRVDGVRYTSSGPMLTSGSLRIPFGAVVEVGAEG